MFHYLGPAFAVLLFARVPVEGVAWFRIVSAGLVFAVWRRPWPLSRMSPPANSGTIIQLGAVLAVMNLCFYEAIARLPLGTVGAIEFIGPIALALAGARTRRNLLAVIVATTGVYTLTNARLEVEPLGIVFAFANALLFTLYIVLAHRLSRGGERGTSINALASAMLVASVAITPFGFLSVAPHLIDPVALLAGIGVGVTSSVIPYVLDQLAMARLRRSTYALFVSMLPATAVVIGVLVLKQFPAPRELIGVALVIAGVIIHET